MEASDFLLQANRLLVFAKENSGEVDARTAASRAYYSAYHQAAWLDDYLENHGAMAGRSGTHESRYTKFSQYPSRHNVDGVDEASGRKIQSIGYKLKSLHAKRIVADYKLDIQKYCNNDAEQAIAEAQAICAALAELFVVFKGELGSQSRSI